MVLNLSVGVPSNTTWSCTLNILNSRSSRTTSRTCCNFSPALLAAAVIFTSSPADSPETFSNVPQTLSGDDNKPARIQRPRSRKAESCTTKCVGTCIRGGSGSPGEGPLNVRRPLVVFKQGFRSRQYWQASLLLVLGCLYSLVHAISFHIFVISSISLVECSDICNLIKDGEDYDWP